MVRVLFICLGNICRSPAAEAVMNKMVAERGLNDSILCDSAGTSGCHAGEPADPRMRRTGEIRGYSLNSRSRQFDSNKDFVNFDYLITMDGTNHRAITKLADNGINAKIKTMCSFVNDPQLRSEGVTEVPDPYYGGPEGFDYVFDILEDACAGLLAELLTKDELERTNK